MSWKLRCARRDTGHREEVFYQMTKWPGLQLQSMCETLWNCLSSCSCLQDTKPVRRPKPCRHGQSWGSCWLVMKLLNGPMGLHNQHHHKSNICILNHPHILIYFVDIFRFYLDVAWQKRPGQVSPGVQRHNPKVPANEAKSMVKHCCDMHVSSQRANPRETN